MSNSADQTADNGQYLPVRQPTDDRKPIKPNPPRFVPSADPDSIVVPGLDTTAPVNDQIDYIEQLITVKLQNVDENIAKVHHLLTTRMLPAFKKYAVGTEPVREAAKFWVNFFEKAARVRLPIYDEISTAQEHTEREEQETEHTQTETDEHPHSEADVTAQPGSFDPDRTPSESSFMPGQGAVSSTPAAFSRHRSDARQESFASQGSDDAPWARSLESPLVRLDREIQSLSLEEHAPPPSLASDAPSVYLDPSVGHERSYTARQDKGKSREIPEPLLHNVLRSKLMKNEVQSAHPPPGRAGQTSPLKFRRRPATPKALNPFLPPETKPEEWNGMVDLRKTPLVSPRRGGHISSYTSAGPSAAPKTPEEQDDDEDLYPPGMSPLTTIQLPTLARPSFAPALGRSPSKEAARRIGRDLISDAQRRGGKGTVETSLSSMPTPPSLQRYTRDAYEPRRVPGTDVSSSGVDTSLESLMRRVGLNVQGSAGEGRSATLSAALSVPLSTLRGPPAPAVASYREPSPPAEEQLQTPEPVYDLRHVQDDDTVLGRGTYQEDSFDSFDDSLDEVNDTAHPSAAFLMASAQRGPNDLDDSFGSSDSGDSLQYAGPPMVFDDGVGFDSFDDDMYDDEGPTETLFGARGPQGMDQLQLRSHGLLEEDTIGVGQQMARAGRIARSPSHGAENIDNVPMLGQ
ncbi:hypothetical protein GLOTRDRAFT_134757 [Gloeophyllum trabeum ATCC 11539]|uniref:DASH complex subunit ASK1 n=1 Tax=Gloeophyllum trabeum (strain ATCC 11539 / FP-39264 / Madison 617) TaxID=670483 RepID=S7QL37_GLOTA|nr:uncharacterized protein GLOTRDRAFT_134757 [Gloeophyllum trabeum ATCC 11539]EPQ59978.1 hypothetical protein GLOTRDRAFT_134757 [Gloeophyllum trabeum ATCC 11539]